MVQSFFLAVGIILIILGAECLIVDTAQIQFESGAKIMTPPDWAPWSMMATGAVVILYSFTIPKRMGS